MRATLYSGVQASHCDDFSCCGAQALGMQALVITACGLGSCGLWGPRECRLCSSWRTGVVAPRHVEFSWTRIELVTFTLAGGFLSTVLPQKS